VIKIEMDVRQAAAVRDSLFRDTKAYTYQPKSCPERVVDIREVIIEIDSQIEEALKNETTDS